MRTPRYLLCASLVILSGVAHARTTLSFVGSEIPRQISVRSPGIFAGSDSLYLNGRLLSRDTDYTFDSITNAFNLHFAPAASDSLLLVFSEIPEWAGKTYGRTIPDVVASAAPAEIPPQSATQQSRGFASDLKLSGAKTFRFNAQSSGSNDFGQSLDLRISGELAPGLELTGALTDRGYDPAYGTASSRLSELDKLNLQLKSRRLLARIGDIILPSTFGGPSKNVSGASVALSYPQWAAHAAAARPKGRFASVSLNGENGYQGPYQVGQQGQARPIVPGSETVYLDGRVLERGLDKDYTVDYPTGQITFSVRNPIDRRSRIEIDYEPLATSYRQELLGGGGSTVFGDSTLIISAEALREGDDRNQLLLGELSEADKEILTIAGDADPFRSGVRTDTTGDYMLLPDSLPDSVYQYVGPSAGQLHVTFTYVGSLKGEYQFLGSNRYEFVGSGRGDYLPVVRLARPERVDYYRSGVELRTGIGNLSADIRQSMADRNLFSELDDDNNNGLFYSLNYARNWYWNGQKGGIKLERRAREATFSQRERLYQADFQREYLLPFGYVPTTDELLHVGSVQVSPLPWLTIEPNLSRLRYQNQFTSTSGGTAATVTLRDRLSFRTLWQGIDAERTGDTVSSGDGNIFSTTARYNLTPNYHIASSFVHDQRKNDYYAFPRGTRYNRWTAGAGSLNESVQYERYEEDSLITAWQESAVRDRIIGTSTRRFGNFNYVATATWQKLRDLQSRESSFLGRTTLNYADSRHRLNVSGSYLISEEVRNARGITYLEVEPGRGNYILEDGRYVPDPFGNYIQIEELLSNRAQVRRGEKSFQFSKDWRSIDVRFSSNIFEELLEGGERQAWWVIPFLSDESQPYLYFARRYDSDIRLLPWANFHAINLLVTDDIEKRTVGSTNPVRRDTRGRLTLKQTTGLFFLEESLELFRSDRDGYYSGVGLVDGYRVAGVLRRVTPTLELSGGGAYRIAESTEQQARLYSLLLGSRVRMLGQGEFRADVELYRQSQEGPAEDYSYQLTEAKYGTRGAVWTIGANYGIRKGMKINATLIGRHSDDRPGRVTGRGEVVASF